MSENNFLIEFFYYLWFYFLHFRRRNLDAGPRNLEALFHDLERGIRQRLDGDIVPSKRLRCLLRYGFQILRSSTFCLFSIAACSCPWVSSWCKNHISLPRKVLKHIFVLIITIIIIHLNVCCTAVPPVCRRLKTDRIYNYCGDTRTIMLSSILKSTIQRVHIDQQINNYT